MVICCGVYPGVLWAIGQTCFPFQVERQHRARRRRQGHRLAAGRPAVHQGRVFPAASVGGVVTTPPPRPRRRWRLELRAARPRRARDRADRDLRRRTTRRASPSRPTSRRGSRPTRPAASPHIVAQWADAHNGLAQAWVTGDPTHGAYVDAWAKAHADVVKNGSRTIPARRKPKAADLAVVFFETFSNEHPGMFPSAVTKTGADGKPRPTIEPVNAGVRHPVDLLRHVAAGPSRRRAEGRARRPRHGVGFGPRPAHHARKRRVPARPRRRQVGRRQEARRRRRSQGDRGDPARQGERAVGRR